MKNVDFEKRLKHDSLDQVIRQQFLKVPMTMSSALGVSQQLMQWVNNDTLPGPQPTP